MKSSHSYPPRFATLALFHSSPAQAVITIGGRLCRTPATIGCRVSDRAARRARGCSRALNEEPLAPQ